MCAGLSNGKDRGRERYEKEEAERQGVCLCVCLCVCEVFLQQPVRAGGPTVQTNGPLN